MLQQKKAKSSQISKVNAGKVKAVTKRRNVGEGGKDHGGKNRRNEKVFQMKTKKLVVQGNRKGIEEEKRKKKWQQQNPKIMELK